MPDDPVQRLVLRCLRRMAAHGIRDAQAGLWLIEQFGPGFRRPLVLLRAFVVELAQASDRIISIAPCCAMAMTLDEARMMEALSAAGLHEQTAAAELRRLTARPDISAPLSIAAALNTCLAELGRPLKL